jgi:RNA polymerase sigma-70 factor (ECF subfamily)
VRTSEIRPPLAEVIADEPPRRSGPAGLAAFETVMRQHNRMLYRVARAILKDDGEAEDALQDAYIAAYCHLADYRGAAKLSTWLTRIVINQALAHLRKRSRHPNVVTFAALDGEETDRLEASAETAMRNPEQAALRAEIRRALERKIDDLPEAFRTVFVLREVEEMSVEETAACLDISAATVRSRLFRAKARLREALTREIDTAAQEIFAFAGARCDRIVATVLARLSTAFGENPVR